MHHAARTMHGYYTEPPVVFRTDHTNGLYLLSLYLLLSSDKRERTPSALKKQEPIENKPERRSTVVCLSCCHPFPARRQTRTALVLLQCADIYQLKINTHEKKPTTSRYTEFTAHRGPESQDGKHIRGGDTFDPELLLRLVSS